MVYLSKYLNSYKFSGLIFGELKIPPYICSSSLNTYQERRRVWPYEALATHTSNSVV
jgi:hypothetical protein